SHPQRLRRRRRPRPDRGDGDLSAGRRINRGARSVARIHGRAEEDREAMSVGNSATKMRILVTNDDGIHSPGLDICAEIARALSDDIWIVAPETDQSGVSHSLSLNDPLRLRQIEERRFAVKGTPTDCVVMGLRHILNSKGPDLVLSGVN